MTPLRPAPSRPRPGPEVPDSTGRGPHADRPAVPLGVRLARLAYAAIPLGMVAVLLIGSFI